MAEKISKTARASMRNAAKKHEVKACPLDEGAMVATKVMKTRPRGMYWICQTCDHRIKI